MRSAPKTTAITLTPMLQRIFIVGILISYLAQIVQIAHLVLQQLPHNRNLSGFLTVSVTYLLLPLIFLVIAYCIGPKSRGTQARLFVAVLLSLLGMAYVGVMGQIVGYVYQYAVLPGDGFWNYVVYEWAAHAVAIAAYVITLSYLRRTKNL